MTLSEFQGTRKFMLCEGSLGLRHKPGNLDEGRCPLRQRGGGSARSPTVGRRETYRLHLEGKALLAHCDGGGLCIWTRALGIDVGGKRHYIGGAARSA